MEVFEALKKNLTETAQFAAEKAKLAKDILVANDQIRSKKKEMRRLTYKIGQTYLDLHAEDCDEEFKDFVRGYFEAKEELEVKQAEMDSLKEQMKESGFGDVVDSNDVDTDMSEFSDEEEATEEACESSETEEDTEETPEVAEEISEEVSQEAQEAVDTETEETDVDDAVETAEDEADTEEEAVEK